MRDKNLLILALINVIALAGSGFGREHGVDLARRAAELKNLRWGMFVCWSFSTYSGREWSPGITDLSFFRATEVDTDQWAQTAKEAGMGYMLFLTKHHDGFCLWDTKTTDRKVTKAPLGRDVLAELKKSCDKHGVKLALYFSSGDWTWPGALDGQSAGTQRQDVVGGNNPEGKKEQLRELLTQYGPIEFIWFDRAAGNGGLSDEETAVWVKSLQPGCLVGGLGKASNLKTGEGGRPRPADKPYLVTEFTYPIQPPGQGGAMWFYSLPINENKCWPAGVLYRDYLRAAEFGNIFSLNVGPNYEGRLRPIDVATLQEVGQMIREKAPMPGNIFGSLSFGKEVTASSQLTPHHSPCIVANDDFRRGPTWVAGAKDSKSAWVQIDLGEELEVGAAVLRDAGGQTRQFTIEYRDGDAWRTVVTGTSIQTHHTGKAYLFSPVKARVFRLNIRQSAGPSSISKFQLYAPGATLPSWVEKVNVSTRLEHRDA